MHLVNIQLPAQRISCPVPTPQMRVNPPRAGLSLLRYLRLVLETNDHTKRSILSCRNVIPILLCWRYIGNKCKPLNSPVYKLSPTCRLLYRCQKLVYQKISSNICFRCLEDTSTARAQSRCRGLEQTGKYGRVQQNAFKPPASHAANGNDKHCADLWYTQWFGVTFQRCIVPRKEPTCLFRRRCSSNLPKQTQPGGHGPPKL